MLQKLAGFMEKNSPGWFPTLSIASNRYFQKFDADTALLPETTVKVKLTSGDREILTLFRLYIGKNSNAIIPVTTREAAAHKLLTTVEWNSQYAHDDSMAMFFIPWRDFEEQFVYRKHFVPRNGSKSKRFQTDFVDTFEHENYSADIYFDERHQSVG